MFSNRVMTVDSEGRSEVLLTMEGDRPSGLGWLPDGKLLVVSMERNQLLSLDSGGSKVAAELQGVPSTGVNDMVVDERGRAYIGSRVGPVLSETPNGQIIMVEPSGSAKVVAQELAFPNGSVITPDGKTFIVAETRGNRLTAFDIAADGSLANRRLFAEVHDPDGICLDAEGAIWVACPGLHEFVRAHEGGRISQRIHVSEAKMAVACMLGGPERRTLFLSTSETQPGEIGAMAIELRETRRVENPFGRAHGRIETVDVSVPGAGRP